MKNYENKITEIEKEKKNFISQLNLKREKNKLLKEIEKKNYELECFIHDFVKKKLFLMMVFVKNQIKIK